MSETVNLRNGAALDARFMAVDERFNSINKDMGRIEGRVEALEENHILHHDGLAKHDHAIDKLTTALTGFEVTIKEINATIQEWSGLKNQVKGGITLWKWVLVPIGGFSGLLYIVRTLWGGI